ncbi:hypothetical protein BDF20DRAFT_903103 [Mycotypha africana]|uniref:uncharacterized protein n=1 Tax=Mycotypha africana TaxID=64632 RepID=UPI002301A0E6|nr:uncharacterized protein BDF20DRAFT_903103 [Mycotypha africana]KAI8967044.1 hypothetical protein BDF20DRAFT_903103 [Mycotypha africana]
MTDDNNVSNAHTTLRKRNRASFSSSSNEHVEPHPLQPQQDKLSHNKVMEALKAKIQRGNSGPNTGGNNNGASSSSNVPNGTSGTTTFTTSSVRSTTQNHHQESNSSNNSSNKRRKPTLPKPSVLVKQQPLEPKAKSTTSTTPSPRSAKPILPPIDTSLGRTDCASTKFPNHPLSQHQSSGSSSSSHSTAINSFNDTTSSHTITRNVKLEEQSASMDNDKQADTRNDTAHHNIYDTHNTLKLNTTVSSPSDHILLNTRRARSLSPSPSTTSAQK